MNKINEITLNGLVYKIDGIIPIDIDDMEVMYNIADQGVYKTLYNGKAVGILFITNILSSDGNTTHILQTFLSPYRLDRYIIGDNIVTYSNTFINPIYSTPNIIIQTRRYNIVDEYWSDWRSEDLHDDISLIQQDIDEINITLDEIQDSIEQINKDVNGYTDNLDVFHSGAAKSVTVNNETRHPDQLGDVNLTGIIKDGKSAYEIWRDGDPTRQDKNEYDYLEWLNGSGFETKAVQTRPNATDFANHDISSHTIYAIPDENGNNDPETWSEWIYNGITLDDEGGEEATYDAGNWLLLATHDGSGLSATLTDIAMLQGRDEPIVFTESKELNRCIKKLFVDTSGFNGNYDGGGGTGEILNLYIKYTYSSSKYISLYSANTGSNQVLYIGLDGSGIYNTVYPNGIYYYLEIDEQLLPSATSVQRSKLTSWATDKANDPRILDGGYTQSPMLNKYIKKLWIEFPDDYTLPSGYNSLDDLKKDICVYSLNHNNVVDGIYKPKFYFRLKGVNGQFIQYDNSDGILGEINFKDSAHGNIVLHAVIDWKSLKGKRFSGYIPVNPICFDEVLYHDSSIGNIDERLVGIENYFEGGEFDSFDVVDYTNSFPRGFIVTSVGDDIRNASITGNDIYRHLFLSISEGQIQDGDIIEARGRNGSSSNFVSLIKNNIVVAVVARSTISDYTVVVDSETFDTILFNAKTNDEGFYVRRKRPITIERPPLIEDFDNLKQTVEEMGGESVASKRSIKIVCFGNSFTEDSFSYLPPILKEVAPNLEFTIMLARIGGSPLAQHCANFTGSSQTIEGTTYNVTNYGCAVFTDKDSSWQSKSTITTIDDILNYEDWDIITFQQLSGQSYKEWETYFQPFIYKIHKALFSKISSLSNLKTKRVKLGWILTHGKGSSFVDSKKQWEGYSYSQGVYPGIINNSKMMLDKSATEIIFPYGTAIQNLRTKSAINALGDSGGLLADGTHLHEGIGPLCAAYTNLLVILREAGYENISIIGEKIGLSVSTSWITSIGVLNPNPSSQTTVVGITSDNVYLAQVAAIAAVKNPFELSFDVDGESEKGVTLDDFIPTIENNE